MVPELVCHDVGLGQRGVLGAEIGLQLREERDIQIHGLIAGAVERAHLCGTGAARRRRRLIEHDECGLDVVNTRFLR